jgi:hypothetical protein
MSRDFSEQKQNKLTPEGSVGTEAELNIQYPTRNIQ